MPQKEPTLSMNYAKEISHKLQISERQAQSVLDFFQDGATVPFLARYRKEQTGGLDEEQLRSIQTLHATLLKFETRRSAILKALRENAKLTKILEESIHQASTLAELEDIYLPHKSKRKTRATTAKELGLEPLAQLIVKQPRDPHPTQAARRFVQGKIGTVEEALRGARDIVAEMAAENPKLRKIIRNKAERFGRLKVQKRKNAEDPKQTYRSYYEFDSGLNRLQAHQVLAIDRAEKEKILKVSLELQVRDWKEPLSREFGVRSNSPWGHELQAALDDCAKRLLLPAIERELRRGLTEKAQDHAIGVFATNLESLLMVPPLTERTVLALDPGFRSGCKLAVVDPTGKLLATDTIYPHPPQGKSERALGRLEDLVKRHKVSVVAIGNGTASRETEKLVANLETPYLIVSEAGASVYSASPLARQEFPGLDVSIRGAISIARRIQDPLAELIKIDPKSVGVGLYQHDLDGSRLDKALAAVVESVVHRVGVDLNTASAQLLAHIGGIGPKTAENVIAFRDKNGRFPDRATLKKVKGLGPKAYELAAGFVRVLKGKEPLDATAIHPESYKIAKSILSLTKGCVEACDPEFIKEQVDCPLETLKDILEQLQRPGRDPREDLPLPILRSGVLSLDDLTPGLTLSGTVRNVVPFGAFVDIGVKEDGLIHVSKLKSRTLSVGEVVEAEILEVDEKRGRISLGLV